MVRLMIKWPFIGQADGAKTWIGHMRLLIEILLVSDLLGMKMEEKAIEGGSSPWMSVTGESLDLGLTSSFRGWSTIQVHIFRLQKTQDLQDNACLSITSKGSTSLARAVSTFTKY